MADPILTDAERRALLLQPKRSRSKDKEVEYHDPRLILQAADDEDARSRPATRLFRRYLLSSPGTQ